MTLFKVHAIIWICLISPLYAVNINLPHQNQASNLENILVDKINKLKEVQAQLKSLKRYAGKDAWLSSLVDKRPDNRNPYFIIDVGFSRTDRFESFYTFEIDQKYIDGKGFIDHILVLDKSGFYIPLKKWRRNHPNGL